MAKTVSMQELAEAERRLGIKMTRGRPKSKEDDDPYRTRLRNRGKADVALSNAQGTLVLGFTDELVSEARSLFDHIEGFRHLINKPIRSSKTR